MIEEVRSVLRRARTLLRRDPDRFLRRVKGVIHVGANTGQEREQYDRHRLRVLWVEPIPEIFAQLKANLAGFPRQRPVQALVSDRDGAEYEFHVANNGGASSSILDFKLHKDIWPEVAYERTIKLRSTTLPSLLDAERVDAADYGALVMDTQGSELLVLKGAVPILHKIAFIKTEVPDFESYAGCATLNEMDSFLRSHGFREHHRHCFAQRAGGGNYYDVVYRRT